MKFESRGPGKRCDEPTDGEGATVRDIGKPTTTSPTPVAGVEPDLSSSSFPKSSMDQRSAVAQERVHSMIIAMRNYLDIKIDEEFYPTVIVCDGTPTEGYKRAFAPRYERHQEENHSPKTEDAFFSECARKHSEVSCFCLDVNVIVLEVSDEQSGYAMGHEIGHWIRRQLLLQAGEGALEKQSSDNNERLIDSNIEEFFARISEKLAYYACRNFDETGLIDLFQEDEAPKTFEQEKVRQAERERFFIAGLEGPSRKLPQLLKLEEDLEDFMERFLRCYRDLLAHLESASPSPAPPLTEAWMDVNISWLDLYLEASDWHERFNQEKKDNNAEDLLPVRAYIRELHSYFSKEVKGAFAAYPRFHDLEEFIQGTFLNESVLSHMKETYKTLEQWQSNNFKGDFLLRSFLGFIRHLSHCGGYLSAAHFMDQNPDKEELIGKAIHLFHQTRREDLLEATAYDWQGKPTRDDLPPSLTQGGLGAIWDRLIAAFGDPTQPTPFPPPSDTIDDVSEAV